MTRAYKFLLAAMVGVALAQPGYGQAAAASQIGNNAFDSLNRALRVDAVATGGGGSSSSPFLNLDQLFSSVYDSANNALKVNIVSGLPCTASAGGAITCAATGTNQDITLAPSGTGASIVTHLEDKGGQVFSVKAYGAAGDGTTDDTAAINVAYQAATAVKGTVFFPCGTYKTTSAIADSGPVTWQGADRGCVTIGPPAGSAFDVFDVTSSDVAFKDLTINANSSSSTSNGVTLTGAPLDHITFDHVTVENAGNWCVTWGNPAASAVSDLLVADSTFTGCGGPQFGGLTSGSVSASNLQFSNDVFGNTTNPPSLLTAQAHVSLYISNTGTGTFSNIVIDNSIVEYPILGNGGTQQESDGVVISTGGTAGATISGVTVSGNILHGTDGSIPENNHALEFWGVSDLVVQSNWIGNAYNGTLLQQGAAGTPCGAVYAGNSFDMPLSPNVAVSLGANCSTQVTGNKIIAGYQGIQINGSDQQLVGNSVSATNGIDLKCQESSNCTGDVVNSNTVANATRQTKGIMFDAGTSNFAGINVIGDSIANVTYGVLFYAAGSTGRIQVLFDGNVSHPYELETPTAVYDVPSGFIAKETGTAAPTTACSNGSTFTNTSGGAGTTFYGCEAGAWVAK